MRTKATPNTITILSLLRRDCIDHALARYAPIGFPLKKERTLFGFGYGLSIGISLQFLTRYADEKLILKYFSSDFSVSERMMPDITYLLKNCFLGFQILALFMIFFALYHYAYHFIGSKSIYLMRRLPTKGELLKRCITLPIFGAVLCFVTALLLLLIYYSYYMLATPKQYLPPDQWQKLWSVIL